MSYAAFNWSRRRNNGIDQVDEMHVQLPCVQHRSDQELTRAAVNALRRDTRVPDERLKLRVNHGWITLEGTVDHRYQREAAEEALRRLMGLRHLENRIEAGRS